MLTNDFTRWDNKEQFQEWFKDHCKECWDIGYGDCDKCKQIKANIEKHYANTGKTIDHIADDGKKVLTDKDIINRLTELAEFCRKCGNLTKENDVLNNACDLINQQQAEIEKLNVELVGMRGACNSYKMHYDNAKEEIERLKKGWKSDVIETENIKAETIKEFAERLKIAFIDTPMNYYDIEKTITNLVKEMVGADNG